jgi:hypothetical protein
MAEACIREWDDEAYVEWDDEAYVVDDVVAV